VLNASREKRLQPVFGRALSIVTVGLALMAFGLVLLTSTFPDALGDLSALGSPDVALFWLALLVLLPLGLVLIAAVFWTLTVDYLTGN
jgi:ABC-type Na+ efflux pump permease subunit